MKSNIKNVEIRYVFTEDERNALGPKIARLSQDIQEKQDEKKSVVADYNAQIKSIEKDFNENVNRLNNGFEMRWIPVRAYKNYLTSQWEYFSLDTFDLVKTEEFGPYDYQVDVDEAPDTTPRPFSELDEAAPVAEGTETTNPTLFTALLRELNYWRGLLADIQQIEDQDSQIDEGIKINAKIEGIEAALRQMQTPEEEPQPETETEQSETADADQTDTTPEEPKADGNPRDSKGRFTPRTPPADQAGDATPATDPVTD